MERRQNDERIAVLETESAQFKDLLKSQSEKLDCLIANMNKQKGFWGGMVFAATALGAFLQYMFLKLMEVKTSSN